MASAAFQSVSETTLSTLVWIAGLEVMSIFLSRALGPRGAVYGLVWIWKLGFSTSWTSIGTGFEAMPACRATSSSLVVCRTWALKRELRREDRRLMIWGMVYCEPLQARGAS